MTPTLSFDNTTPASKIEFRDGLTACLALVAPVGMQREDRNEWLKAAWIALRHLPNDLLHLGCQKAMRKADHPSKIVPIIMDEVDVMLRRRVAAKQDPYANAYKVEGPRPISDVMKSIKMDTSYTDEI